MLFIVHVPMHTSNGVHMQVRGLLAEGRSFLPLCESGRLNSVVLIPVSSVSTGHTGNASPLLLCAFCPSSPVV